MVLAEFTVGNALVVTLSIFFVIIWIWILIAIISDLFRDHELSGWLKALWLFALLFIPVLTALIYLIARGDGMRKRSIDEQIEAKQQFDRYVQETAATSAGGSAVDELHRLNDLKASGAITDEEFAQLKAKIVAG